MKKFCFLPRGYMQYVKKVLVLKNTENNLSSSKRLNGLLRVEIEDGVAEAHISLINLPSNILEDYFLLFIDCEKTEFEFELGSRPKSSVQYFPTLPKIDKGFCAGVFVIKDSLPLILGFASDCEFLSLQDFKRVLADRCLARHKKLVKDRSVEEEFCPNGQPVLYNDEAVATENYFELDDQINEKLLSLKERKNEGLQFENEFFDCECQKETQKNFSPNSCTQNETNAFERQEYKGIRHFDTVKAELNEIFFKFPEEEGLSKHFKNSRWARIYYSKEKYYVVGLVYEDGQEKYICYGVPANYSKTPPKELDGFCSFIPLSVFDMFGAGYWIMFQDAISGKCVHFG